MKYLLFTLNIVWTMQLYGQVSSQVFASLDEREILSRLFDDAMLIRNSENTLTARWKPNYAERMVFPMGIDDEMCYTEIDTIFRFLKGDVPHALFVFATYETTKNGAERAGGCHVCAPMLSVALFSENVNSNRGWYIDNFQKVFTRHGSWGEIGDISLVQIGREEFALVLDSYYLAQGFSDSSTSYYDLRYYTQIFSAATSQDNGGAALSEDETFAFETRVEIRPGDEAYYRIQCTSTGTKYLYKQAKMISVEGVKTYVFDEERRMYVEEQE